MHYVAIERKVSLGSETAEHAFDSALQLAHDNDAQLQPLYVVDNPLMAYDAPGYDPMIPRNACEEGQRLMADALARMKHENVAGVHAIGRVRKTKYGSA